MTTRNSYLLRTYGITEHQYYKLLAKQGGGCWICHKTPEEEGRFLAVDHAHGESEFIPKGAVRGLLCSFCNQFLIGRHKNPAIFTRAGKYLRRHTGVIVPISTQKRKRRKQIQRRSNYAR